MYGSLGWSECISFQPTGYKPQSTRGRGGVSILYLAPINIKDSKKNNKKFKRKATLLINVMKIILFLL